MPAPSSPKTLYRIDECPDLMADGVVGDENGNLVFISLWARDTAVQEFLARLTLGRDEQGLDQFHVITEQGASIPVFVGNVENLEKRSARAYRRTLFGSLTNIWLFDRRCVKPDKANASALALLPRDSTHRLDRLWTLVRDTCPLPLLDPWRDTVLELLQAKSMLTRLPFALGPLEGHRLAIDVPTLTQVLGGLIRSGALVGGHPPAASLGATARSGGLRFLHRTCTRACPHPFIFNARRFHGPHVPAARPQLRQERVLPHG
jgi:hypothetical protein